MMATVRAAVLTLAIYSSVAAGGTLYQPPSSGYAEIPLPQLPSYGPVPFVPVRRNPFLGAQFMKPIDVPMAEGSVKCRKCNCCSLLMGVSTIGGGYSQAGTIGSLGSLGSVRPVISGGPGGKQICCECGACSDRPSNGYPVPIIPPRPLYPLPRPSPPTPPSRPFNPPIPAFPLPPGYKTAPGPEYPAKPPGVQPPTYFPGFPSPLVKPQIIPPVPISPPVPTVVEPRGPPAPISPPPVSPGGPPAPLRPSIPEPSSVLPIGPPSVTPPVSPASVIEPATPSSPLYPIRPSSIIPPLPPSYVRPPTPTYVTPPPPPPPSPPPPPPPSPLPPAYPVPPAPTYPLPPKPPVVVPPSYPTAPPSGAYPVPIVRPPSAPSEAYAGMPLPSPSVQPGGSISTNQLRCKGGKCGVLYPQSAAYTIDSRPCLTFPGTDPSMCKRATRARLRVRCVPPRQPGTPCIGIPLSLTKTCYPGSGQNPQECTPTDAQNPLVSPILRLVDAFTQINQPASIPNSAMANPSASVMTPGAGPGCCSVALQENQLMTACNCKQANGNICIMDESCTVFNRSIPTGITYNFTTPISCQEAINQQILVDDDIRQCEANVEQLQVKVKCVQPPGAAPTCFPYIDDRQPSSYFEPYSHISKEAIAQPTQTPLTPSVWQGPVGCCDVYIRPSHLVVACGCESTAEQSSISSCSQALLNDDLARCTMSKQFSARDLPNIQNSSHRKTTKRTLGELANTVAYSLPITCSKALDEGLIEPSAIEQCRSQVLIPQTHPTYSYRYTYEDSNLDTGTPTQPVLTTQPVLVDIPGKQSVPAQPSPQYSYPQWPGYATTRSDSQPSVQPAYSQWQQYGTYSAGSSYESQHGQQSSPQVYNPSIPMNGYGFYTTAPYQSTTPPPPTSVIPLAPRAQTPSYKSPNNHGYPAGYQEPTRHPYTIGKFGTSTNRVMVPSQADLTTESALQGESSACTPLNSAQWLLGFISLFILFIL